MEGTWARLQSACHRLGTRLSPWVGRFGLSRSPQLLVTATAFGYAVTTPAGNAIAELAPSGPNGVLVLTPRIPGDPRSRAPAVLQLTESDVLRRKVALPRAAARHWESTVRLQFESWFPLPESAAVWRATVEAGPVGTEVVIQAARRDLLDREIERLQAAGLRVVAVRTPRVMGKTLELYRPRASEAGRWPPRDRALLTGAIGLVAVAFALVATQRQQEVQDLQELLAASRRAALTAERDLARLTAERALVDRVDADLASATAAQVLADLAEHLPGTAWVREVGVTDEEVTLTLSAPKGFDLKGVLTPLHWVQSIGTPSFDVESNDPEREQVTVGIATGGAP